MKICPQCKTRVAEPAETCPRDGTPLEPMPDEWTGARVGPFHVTDTLAHDAVATVVRATDPSDGRVVALLLVPLVVALNNRLDDAVAALRGVSHPHLAPIVAAGEHASRYRYVALEWVAGSTLRERIADGGPLPPRRALEVVRALADALACLHAAGLVHGAVTADAVALGDDDAGEEGAAREPPRVVLGRYGALRPDASASSPPPTREVYRDRRAQVGEIPGLADPSYASPEQMRGLPPSAASDLYALGIVLFEALTGRRPFGGTTAELIVAHLKQPPPAPSSLLAAVPGELDALVARLLAKRPSDRGTARELASAVDDALRALPGSRVRNSTPFFSMANAIVFDAPAPPAATAAEAGVEAPIAPVVEQAPANDVVPAPPSPAPPSPAREPRQWAERLPDYRRAITAVYDKSAPAPAWVRESLERFALQVARAAQLEAQAEHVARQLAEHATQAARCVRIARALDELARDERASCRELDRLEARAAPARSAVAQAAEAFRRCWTEQAARVLDPALSQLQAEAAAAAVAARIAAWREAALSLAVHEEAVARERAARDDLRFQLEQLRGRQGAAGAHDRESSADDARLRARAAELGAALAEAGRELAIEAGVLDAHLAAFPAARRLLGGGAVD